jgi:hypothetical protein
MSEIGELPKYDILKMTTITPLLVGGLWPMV